MNIHLQLLEFYVTAERLETRRRRYCAIFTEWRVARWRQYIRMFRSLVCTEKEPLQFFVLWSCGPERTMAWLFVVFLITHDASQSVGLIWMSDQSDTQISTRTTQRPKRQPCMSSAEFEPAISASDRPQTDVLDGAANVNKSNVTPKEADVTLRGPGG
jgi:hypothetical protein